MNFKFRINWKYALLSFIAGLLIIKFQPYLLIMEMNPITIFRIILPLIMASLILSIVILADSNIFDVMLPLIPVLFFKNGFFFFIGVLFAYYFGKKEEKQYLTPRISRVFKQVVSVIFITYFIFQAYVYFENVQVKIPESFYDASLSFTKGSLPCSLNETIKVCIDKTTKTYIKENCQGNSLCISQAMANYDRLRKEVKKSFESQFGKINENETFEQLMREKIDEEIKNVLNKIGINKVRLFLIFAFFAYFKFVVDVTTPIFAFFGWLLIKLFILLKFFKEEKTTKEAIKLSA